MRNKYRLWVCPVPTCPKVGGRGSTCRDHDDKKFIPITVTRDKPKIPDALKTSDQKTDEFIRRTFGA